ncbi:hypothetical protein AJ79_09074 [Helicocarpus griseus UAMH5409]|uniref:Uncharacterized protein n=1 Tax=Helicocarpus griseus UAMH5409 TaxID=1447875 RepID=A0A2B7WMR7_9EURO|nr:hypothetical protein AJ79_09074 [Helicocarpus griseus UAMH5409]
MATDIGDAELRLEVDLMTLDYLCCKAIEALVKDRIAQRTGQQQPRSMHGGSNGEIALGMFDAFMQLFQYNFPNNRVDDNTPSLFPETLKIKLQILTITNLFCRRYRDSSSSSNLLLPSEETVQASRQRNKERTERWLRGNSAVTMSNSKPTTRFAVVDKLSLKRNLRDMYLHMRVPSSSTTSEEASDASLSRDITLLDILPECMTLCGMIFEEASQDDALMELPIKFMLYAAIEGILIGGKSVAEAADEAFAWDCPCGTDIPDDSDSDEVISRWKNMRDSMKTSLITESNCQRDWEERIKKILDNSPFIQFEEIVLEWLQELLEMQGTPILQQLEAGKLDGLTEEETVAFMERVGIIK